MNKIDSPPLNLISSAGYLIHTGENVYQSWRESELLFFLSDGDIAAALMISDLDYTLVYDWILLKKHKQLSELISTLNSLRRK